MRQCGRHGASIFRFEISALTGRLRAGLSRRGSSLFRFLEPPWLLKEAGNTHKIV
jgi:hypothetical protein